MDWNEKTPLLTAKLDALNVKTRQQSGRNLSYVEGWHVIAEMNRIFGHGGWNRETVYLKEVSRQEVEIGQHKKPGWKVGFEAKVRVTVDGVTREGTGYGSGTMTDLFDCIESAGKEAETDAMKRAAMTFGNPFGLALYDKEQKEVEKTPPAEPKPKLAPHQQAANWADWFKGALMKCERQEDMLALLNDPDKMGRVEKLKDFPETHRMMETIIAEQKARLRITN